MLVTMNIGRRRFNLYLLLILLVGVAAGCKTEAQKKAKELATLRVHVEVIPESLDFSTSVPIYREKPVMVTVDKSPFLTEANVAGAKVVDEGGGYALEIRLDRQGSWLLEEYTTTNPGKHFAVFSAFRVNDKKVSRWLGAPIFGHRISKGVFTFTPDATREETEAIVLGLNNVAKKNRENSKW